jgi:hypothetical protein
MGNIVSSADSDQLGTAPDDERTLESSCESDSHLVIPAKSWTYDMGPG